MSRLAFVLFLGVASCAAPQLPAPLAADVPRAQDRWPEVTLARLEEGRTLYRSHCSRCHQLYEPRRYPAEEWPEQVAAMRERARVDVDQERLIVAYLTAIAARSDTERSGDEK